MSSEITCLVSDCARRRHGRVSDYCDTHLYRFRRYGDPLYRQQMQGDLATRYTSKVDVRGADECWPWLAGPYAEQSTPVISVNKRNLAAHRVGWFVLHGSWPPAEQEICHTCDNRRCMNPAHWWLGTHAENMADMQAKGRGRQSRFSAQDVEAMRAAWLGGETQQSIADRYGTVDSHVCTLMRRHAAAVVDHAGWTLEVHDGSSLVRSTVNVTPSLL